MGNEFREADGNNPEGYWEDLEMRNHNATLLANGVILAKWIKGLAEMLRRRKEPWGFKDPRLSYVLGHYLSFAPNAKIVRCVKETHRVAESMCYAYGWPYIDSLRETVRREDSLDRLVAYAKVLRLNMNELQPEEDLVETIGDFINA